MAIHSMTGRIESGQLCTVVPIDAAMLEVDDIELCKVAGNEYLHIVKAIQDGRYQIGNNRGFVNGWIGREHIFGKCLRTTLLDLRALKWVWLLQLSHRMPPPYGCREGHASFPGNLIGPNTKCSTRRML